MKYIDLHVHSNISDGTLTPKEVVELAYKANLSAIALTDHDSIGGISEAGEAVDKLTSQGKEIRLIPGIEITVEYKDRSIHILGLLLDPYNQTLLKGLTAIRKNRNLRNEKMLKNLRDIGIDISVEVLLKDEENAVLTRAHFANFLTTHGYTKDRKEAFSKYLGSSTPYYVKREYLTPEEGIQLIHEAGGLAILAHPLLYKYNLEEIDTLVQYLCQWGLDGIETIYSLNKGQDEQNIRNIARKYNLLISGGSDFHGANKPYINIGTGLGNLKVPYKVLENLESSSNLDILRS